MIVTLRSLFSKMANLNPVFKLSLQDIKDVQSRAKNVEINADVRASITRLRKELRQQNIQISDRRWKKIARVLKIAAASMDSDKADRTMLLLLKYMLWDKPEQKAAIRNILIDATVTGEVNLDKMKKDSKELYSLVENTIYGFPYTIKCDACSVEFTNLLDLDNHAQKNPEHGYSDVSQGGNKLSRYGLINYDQVLQAISNNININKRQNDLITKRLGNRNNRNSNSYFMGGNGYSNQNKTEEPKTDLSKKQRELFNKELKDLSEQFTNVKLKISKEKVTLKESLAANIWLFENDRAEVIKRWEDKHKTLSEIETNLSLTENLLKPIADEVTNEKAINEKALNEKNKFGIY